MSLNKFIFMGRFCAAPEARHTGNGIPVTSFTIACDRDFKNKSTGEKETDFIDCVAWNSTADFVAKHFTRGSQAVVSGRLQIRSYTDKDGNKRKAAEVIVGNIYFAESKKAAEGDATPVNDPYNAPYPKAPAFAEVTDDSDDLPF